MENKEEEFYVSKCLKGIESTFARGSSATWLTYDFQKLSDAIYQRTQVKLSVTTLKRIWGRLKYDSAPTLTTLNALAQFAGYADWRDFKQCHASPKDSSATRSKGQPSLLKSRHRIYQVVGAVMIITASIFIFFVAGRKQTEYDPSQFEFTANQVITEGVPNSVIFRYSAKVRPDSLFIVQTWDMSRKTLVSSDNDEHSSIYYYPGFFTAKLVADGQIVKTHDLRITSGGWLCLIENEPVPVYFKKEQYQKNGFIAVDEAMLAPYRELLTTPSVRFFNHQDLGDLMTNNFTFETTLRNEFDYGTNPCNLTQILIQCKNDVIAIPLASTPCVGDLQLYFCGTVVESNSADLSGFGCDLTEWTSLRIETIDKTATIYVNDVKAYSLSFLNPPTNIVGVQYRFKGAAAVKEAKFITNGKVYEMN